MFRPTPEDLARAARVSMAWQRFKSKRFDIARGAMTVFVIVGFPFALLTAWKFFLLGATAMAIVWLMWALVTAAVPLWVAAHATEAK